MFQIKVSGQYQSSDAISNVDTLDKLKKVVEVPSFTFQLDRLGRNYLFHLVNLLSTDQQKKYKRVLTTTFLNRSHECNSCLPSWSKIYDTQEIVKTINYLEKYAPGLLIQPCSFHYCGFDKRDSLDNFQYSCFEHVGVFKPTREKYDSKTFKGITAFGLLFVKAKVCINEKMKMIKSAVKLGVNVNDKHLNYFGQTPLTFSVLHLEDKTIQLLLESGYKLKKIDIKALEFIEKFLVTETKPQNRFKKYSLFLLDSNVEYRPRLFKRILNVTTILLKHGLRFTDTFTSKLQTSIDREDKRELRKDMINLQNLVIARQEAINFFEKKPLPKPLPSLIGDYLI